MFVLLHRDAQPSRLSELFTRLGIAVTPEGNGLRLTGPVFCVDPAWLRSQPEVAGVIELDPAAPLADRSGREDTVVQVGNARFGGGHFGVIAGPCAVEDEACIDAAAQIAARCGASVLRGGAFKPRTSPYHYQGIGETGLQLLSAAGKRHGLPVVAELMSPEDCETLSTRVELVQIGARNMQNFPLLRAAGRLDCPILLKRGFCATQEEWLLAAEYILAGGNSRVILCERGIRTFEPGQRFTLDLGAVAALKRRTHLPVIVDPSHAAGQAELVEPLALAAVCAGADGLMVEIHPKPASALCDARQALNEYGFSRLMDAVNSLRSHITKDSIERRQNPDA